jgi:DNA-binding GntR family transcriptional regulator
MASVTEEATAAPTSTGTTLRSPRSDLARENLKDRIARIIRADIFSARLRPNERINQDEIAEGFGVSRLPVREALILLESEGLVDTIPHRGTFVHAITRDDIRDHYTVFGLVAGLAVERAATKLSDEQLTAVRHAYEDARATHLDTGALESAYFEFHRLINRAGAGQRLRSQLRLLAKTIPGELFAAQSAWQAPAQDDHRNLLEAVDQRDGALAAEVMRAHLRRSGDFAVRALEAAGFWTDEAQH